jgi:hypothetical protein
MGFLKGKGFINTLESINKLPPVQVHIGTKLDMYLLIGKGPRLFRLGKLAAVLQVSSIAEG